MPVEEIRGFVRYLEARHYAPSTVEHYARHIVRLANYLASDQKSFCELTPAAFDRFLSLAVEYGSNLDTGRTASVVPIKPVALRRRPSLHNQILFSVKAFYEYFHVNLAETLFDKRPARPGSESFRPFLDHIRNRRSQRTFEARSDTTAKAASAMRAAASRLRPEQVLNIIQAATTMRDAFLVVLLYVTGMRIGEARGLLHEDFDLIDDVVWVRPRELENGARVKNQKPRPVAVPRFLMIMYEDYIASDEYLAAFEAGAEFVFCNIRKGRLGRGLSHGNTKEILNGLVRRSGVQFSWHKFRHTHASETIAQGYNLLDVADRLGHASPQTTNSIYKHLFNSEYRKIKLRTHSDLAVQVSSGHRTLASPKSVDWRGD